MANEFYGETEMSPEELYRYTKGGSRFRQIVINLIMFGVIGIIAWFVVPPIVKYYGFFATGVSEAAEMGVFDRHDDSVWLPSFRDIKYIIAFMFIVFFVSKFIFKFIIKPMTKTVFHRTNANLAAIATAEAGKVVYKVDPFGLQYDIRSGKAENRYKLYWRNFTDADYSPEIIRFYKGRKQVGFVLMRAFGDRQREVGQFIETRMNKIKASNSKP